MHNTRIVTASVAAFIAASISTHVLAQSYPTKPIRLIAPYPPGGGVDATARIVGQALSDALGQQVVIDNRGGASGRIGTEIAAKTPPDGYTLLLGSVAPNAIIPGAYAKLAYDSVKDFAPISLVAVTDYVLTVHPSLPVKSVKDLIGLARARPGQIAFASTGNLGGPHLAGELFSQLAKVKMVHVPYKGGGAATTSILGGETPLIFGTGPTVVPHAKAGRLRLVATTGPRRSKTLPELPTVGETLPGHEVTQWYGILAPAGTPPEILSKLNSEIVKALGNPKVVQQLARLGADAVTTTPEQFAAHIKAEISKWGKVVKTSGIPLE
ncbi:MAG: tripartite tricarboxylate transporter substrate binding protein [Betaproteobacteria bacterium]|nr:tripartite tricarboxylate transporter substrate binding protein [Betaproteobacteria bacterium]